ncbi:MAG: radical SAM/SPASM domain-containing protein, partial [Thermodesulfobacteriota bacterium]
LYRSAEPENVSIEITTYCNLTCKMCYKYAYKIGNKHMSLDVFKKINSDLPKDVKKISLSGLGEGLMNPNIVNYFHLCREKHPKAFLDFTTNGYLFSEKIMEDILCSPVDMVTFSLDTISLPIPQMGHKADDKTVSNIKKFSLRIKECGSGIILRLQSVVFSKEQVEEILEFAGRIGVSIVNLIRMDTPSDPGYNRLPIERFRDIFKRSRQWGKRKKISVVSSGYHSLPMRIASHFDKICLQYHNFLYFDVDGNTLPCCVLRNYSLGDIMNLSLKEIWSSIKASEFFKKQKILCKGCDVWRHSYSH